ncbi:MAG: shikimate dehydrogenase family protein [Thermoplasmata archaeon]
MMKFGLIGSPISKSLSPKIHKALMEKNGINGTYSLIKISAIPEKKFLYNFNGLNVTIPLKEKILVHIDVKDYSVNKTGASNTLFINKNKIYGYNTDYLAIVELINRKKLFPESVLVIGAGGAARAAIAALKNFGTEIIHIKNRSVKKINNVIKDFSIEIGDFSNYEMVINGIPPAGDEYLEKILKNISFRMYVDFNYFEKSPLKKIAEENYINGIDGIEILLLQAKKSQEIWNNRKLKDIYLEDLI